MLGMAVDSVAVREARNLLLGSARSGGGGARQDALIRMLGRRREVFS